MTRKENKIMNNIIYNHQSLHNWIIKNIIAKGIKIDDEFYDLMNILRWSIDDMRENYEKNTI